MLLNDIHRVTKVSMLVAGSFSALERTGSSAERVTVRFLRRNSKSKFRLLRFRCSFSELEEKFNANAVKAHRTALRVQKSKQPLRSSADDYGNKTD